MGSFLRIPERTQGEGGTAASYSARPGLRIRLARIKGISKGPALAAPYYFQCPPLDSFQHDHGFDHSRYTTIEGEFSRRGGRRLIAANFRTIVVEWGAFVTEFGFDVQDLANSLVDISEEGYPFDLLAWHNYNKLPELHMPATLDSVSVVEQAGEVDARYLDLAFTEWRDPVVRRKSLGKPRTPARKEFPFTVQLKKDGSWTWPTTAPGRSLSLKDLAANKALTLERIARWAYGKPSYAKYVAKANNIKDWGYDTALIKHSRFKKNGGKIKVPEIDFRMGQIGAIGDANGQIGTLG